MDSLTEIKKTFLDFIDVLEEGLVTQDEFDSGKRKLLLVLLTNQETPLRERLKVLADISHVLSDNEQKKTREALFNGAVANAIGCQDPKEKGQHETDEISEISVLEPTQKVSFTGFFCWGFHPRRPARGQAAGGKRINEDGKIENYRAKTECLVYSNRIRKYCVATYFLLLKVDFH